MIGNSSHQDRKLAAEAAILAGGESRRMGRDKAWLKLGSQSIVENLVQCLKPLFVRLRIIANFDERLASLGVPVQPDLRPRLGPLGGIHAALKTAQAHSLFIIGCDFPFVNASFVRGLASFREGYDAVVPRPKHRPLPVCAFYTLRCMPAIEASLERNELKTTAFLDEVHVRWVEDLELERLDPKGLSLTNLNTPEDYKRAQEIVEKQPHP